MKNILMIKNITKEDIHDVGDKAVKLASLSHRVSVPNGFVITKFAFDRFLKQTGMKTRIKNLISSINLEDKDSLQIIANKIQKMIVNAILPGPLNEEILDTYNCLNIDTSQKLNDVIQSKKMPIVAIRSSSCGYQDYSKLHLSFLNIDGNMRFIKAILASWASFYTGKAIEYRIKNNLEDASYSIIVQKMIPAERSGIVYSTNPSNHNEIMVLACRGLGSAISNGLIMPDRYTLHKSTLEILNSDVKKQDFLFEYDPYKNRTRKSIVKDNLATEQKLNERQIRDLASYGRRIEKFLGRPQQVEYAIEKDNIHILQSQDILGFNEKVLAKEDESLQELETPEEEKEKKPVITFWENKKEQDLKVPVAEEKTEEEKKETAQTDQHTEAVPTVSAEEATTEEKTSEPVVEEKIEAEETTPSVVVEKILTSVQDTTEEKTSELKVEESKPVEEKEEKLETQEIESTVEETQSEKYEITGGYEGEPEKTEKTEETAEQPVVRTNNQTLYHELSQVSDGLLSKEVIELGSKIVSADQLIFAAIKGKYKDVFSKQNNADFNRALNELSTVIDIPHEEHVREVHDMRNQYLRQFTEFETEKVDKAIETAKKFVKDIKEATPKQENNE